MKTPLPHRFRLPRATKHRDQSGSTRPPRHGKLRDLVRVSECLVYMAVSDLEQARLDRPPLFIDGKFRRRRSTPGVKHLIFAKGLVASAGSARPQASLAILCHFRCQNLLITAQNASGMLFSETGSLVTASSTAESGANRSHLLIAHGFVGLPPLTVASCGYEEDRSRSL